MLIPKGLYNKIKKTIPIPCIDLVVFNGAGHILMLKRENEPARGQWWFPGGRVLHGEKREQAVRRKLKEECGLTGIIKREIGTFDVILNYRLTNNEVIRSHAISTFYYVTDIRKSEIVLDSQSSKFKWCSKPECLKLTTDKALKKILEKVL